MLGQRHRRRRRRDADGDRWSASRAERHADAQRRRQLHLHAERRTSTARDSFTYTASDGTAVSNVATVTITVSARQRRAGGGRRRGDDRRKRRAVSGNVLTNDTDVDAGTTLTATPGRERRRTARVTLAANGGFTYTPDAELQRHRQLHLHGERRHGGLERRDGDDHGHRGQRRAGGGRRRGDDDGRHARSAANVLANDTDVDAGTTLTATARDAAPANGTRDAGDGRRLHLHAERELQRHRQLHLHGERRHGGLEHRDGHDHRQRRSTTRRWRPATATPTAEDTPLTIAAPGVLGNDTDVDGASLTAVLVSRAGQRHADAQRRRQLHLHAERELQRHRQLHLSRERRHADVGRGRRSASPSPR